MNNKKRVGTVLLAGLVASAGYFFLREKTPSVPESTAIHEFAETTPTGTLLDPTNNGNTSTHAEISKKDCVTLFDSNQTPDRLTHQKQQHLIIQLRRFAAQYSEFEAGVIADIAGLSKKQLQNALFGFNLEFDSDHGKSHILADNYEQHKNLGIEQMQLFDQLLAKKSPAPLIDALNTGKIHAEKLHVGRSMLSMVLKNNPAISPTEIQSLLDVGLTIHLQALVAAVESNNTEAAKFLTEKYQGKLDTTWSVDGMSVNLTMMAAATFNDELFFYFFERGVSAYTGDSTDYTLMFDVMPEPVTEAQKRRALPYVTDALRHNARSIRLSTVERLKKWLPDDVQQAYRSELTTSWEIPENLIQQGKTLQAEIHDFQARIDSAKATESACQQSYNYDALAYLEELLKKDIDSSELSLATKSLLTEKQRALAQRTLDKASVISAQKPTTVQEQQWQDYLSQQLKLFDVVLEKNWEAAGVLCSTNANPEYRSMLCNHVLSRYFDSDQIEWEFAEKILMSMERWDASLITPLAMNNRLDLIKKFIDHGVRLDQLDDNYNPLSWAIRKPGNTDTIKFLLEHGAPVKPQYPGLDFLDIGLAELDHFNPALRNDKGAPLYATPQDIALLLNAGAPIERSHIEKIQQLKTLNPDAYQALITAVPEFGSY